MVTELYLYVASQPIEVYTKLFADTIILESKNANKNLNQYYVRGYIANYYSLLKLVFLQIKWQSSILNIKHKE